MALSRSDKAFYEEKLNWMTFGYLFVATVVVGTVVWPLLTFYLDWSDGQTSKWNMNVVISLAFMGFLLGSVVSVVMWLIFRFFLWLEWLPSRR